MEHCHSSTALLCSTLMFFSTIFHRIVAMSWPATSFEGLVRNKMSQVVAFLDINHSKGYWVYNLCNERNYATSHFYDRVLRVPMEDHNVPSFRQMITFR
jgi:hypothetical protein